MRLGLDLGGYANASEKAIRTNQHLAQEYARFTSDLSGFASIAGSDSSGESFADGFDDAAAGAVAAYRDLVAAVGAIGVLASASYVNYVSAESASTNGVEEVPYDTCSVPGEDQVLTVASSRPPSVLGGDGAGPGWWHWIADKVGGALYPDADTGGLRQAGRRWVSEAADLEAHADRVEAVGEELGSQAAPEASLARASCATTSRGLRELAETFRDLGEACTGYADDVERHREQMERELRSFIAWTVGIQLASHGLAAVTLGGSELLGQSAQVAKIAAAAAKVRTILAALSTTVVLRLGPLSRVLATTSSISVQAQPLLSAKARMATVRAIGIAGERSARWKKNTKRIESLTPGVKFRIPDHLDRVAKVIGEVKNVKYQALTSQLKDFLVYAESNPGWTFVLKVRPDTKLSKPLQELVDSGRIVLSRSIK